MDERQFQERTKQLALRIVRLVAALPNGAAADVLGRQLLRSATSIGANYRAACRAKSRPDMLSKLGTVEEEADETLYWLELLAGADLVAAVRLGALQQETTEILSMIVAAMKTIRSGLRQSNPKSHIQNPK